MASADECKVAGNAAFKEGRFEQAAQHFGGRGDIGEDKLSRELTPGPWYGACLTHTIQ